jgi:hypothetical protein
MAHKCEGLAWACGTQATTSIFFAALLHDGLDVACDRGLSSSVMGQRLVQHLRRLNLHSPGESVYELKRPRETAWRRTVARRSGRTLHT